MHLSHSLSLQIHFHSNNVQSLHKHIDPSCLPKKYGGTRGEIDYCGADWYPVLAKFEEKIKGTVSFVKCLVWVPTNSEVFFKRFTHIVYYFIEWHSYGYRKH